MSKKEDLFEYLEQEKKKLDLEYPNNLDTTAAFYQKIYDFLDYDFKAASDNRVFRHFLQSFKELLCFAVEQEVSKKYLRYFFTALNKPVFVDYIASHSKTKAKDIRFLMERFHGFFIMTWQGYTNVKTGLVRDITELINYQM